MSNNFKVVFNHYKNLLENPDPIKNIIQTDKWNSMIRKDKVTFPFLLYKDEFEAGNPLGSRATVHHLSGIMYGKLMYFPAEYASRVTSIFLLQGGHEAERSEKL